MSAKLTNTQKQKEEKIYELWQQNGCGRLETQIQKQIQFETFCENLETEKNLKKNQKKITKHRTDAFLAGEKLGFLSWTEFESEIDDESQNRTKHIKHIIFQLSCLNIQEKNIEKLPNVQNAQNIENVQNLIFQHWLKQVFANMEAIETENQTQNENQNETEKCVIFFSIQAVLDKAEQKNNKNNKNFLIFDEEFLRQNGFREMEKPADENMKDARNDAEQNNKKYELAAENWQDMKKLLSTNQDWTVLMPPPNLTGQLHSGHAFQHFLMDSWTRQAVLNGQPATYLPGVDHAGIQLAGVINRLIEKGEFDGFEIGSK